MAVRIRLRRLGAKKRPYYRIVVADSRAPRDGRFIETIGTYHPIEEPAKVIIDSKKAMEWVKKGAQPSESVAALFRNVGLLQKWHYARRGEAEKAEAVPVREALRSKAKASRVKKREHAA